MKNLNRTTVVTLLAIAVVMLFAANSFARKDRQISRTFDAKDLVRINTVSGDCIVKRGEPGKIDVEVIHAMDPDDVYEPEMRERGSSLRLTENIYGSCSGSSVWILTVPEGTRIRFSSASGEFQAEDLMGEFDVSTASGDIEMINCQGELELSSASGDVVVEDCEGDFQCSSASGRVEGIDVKLTTTSSFSSASGSVEVVLGSSPDVDLSVSSASGRATLDYNGNTMNGYFELVVREGKGRIVCTVDFDSEESFRRHGQDYIAKAFTRGPGEPEIVVETASGRATLKE